MVPIFLGLTAVNLLLLATVFGLGLFALDDAGAATGAYSYHVLLAIVAGLMATLTHVSIYTYFMATSKWLAAAADKADLAIDTFVTPARQRKRRGFAVVMAAIGLTMIAMFAGAAADTIRAMPDKLHFVLAVIALLANVACALAEYRLIKEQSALMDEALAAVNRGHHPAPA